MKKVLILGAMQMHVPLLQRAKERGLYTLTCDYIPDNIGHSYANEAHYDSTTDLDAVLKLAKDSAVDAVLTFNSDPAALTAAYVSDKLSLAGSNIDAVRIMSRKDLFRAFLLEKGFNVPKFKQYTNFEQLQKDVQLFSFPIILKPVDSSGSKGIVKIEVASQLEESFNNALTFSKCKVIIVEEFIKSKESQIHGDAFVKDNKLDFIYLGDHHFNSTINNLVPYSTTFPSQHSIEDINRIECEVQRFISEINFKQGGINVEARISAKDNKVYLIEVGPRNGGNFTPTVIQYASGYNFIDATLCASLGEAIPIQKVNKSGYYAYLIIHSEREGVLKSISLSDELNDLVVEKHIYLNSGDSVNSFKGANAAIGVLIMKFSSMDQMNSIVDNFASLYTVEL